MEEKILIRKATLEDLSNIQNLNNELFKLEFNNFDDTLKVGWPFEEDGKNYFQDMIQNQIVFVAEVEGKTVGYLAGSICEEVSLLIETFAELDNMYIEEINETNLQKYLNKFLR